MKEAGVQIRALGMASMVIDARATCWPYLSELERPRLSLAQR